MVLARFLCAQKLLREEGGQSFADCSPEERGQTMLRFTKRFHTSSDTAGAKKTHVEQKITDWLFEQFGSYTLTDTCSVIASVVEAFPPVERKATITPALLEHIQVALVRWGQGLQDLAQPTREEANQMGKELLLLILHEIHSDYVELASDGKLEEETEVTVLDLTLGYLQGMLSSEYSTGDDEIFETALEGVRLLKALGESGEYPHPYVTLPYVPALLFPVKNPVTGKVIWIEMAPSNSGFSLTAHKRKPRIKDITSGSYSTGIAGLHVDYYVAPTENEPELTRKGTPRRRWKHPQEMLKVQLHDEAMGPYSEPHWQIPADYSSTVGDASIVLIHNVQQWKASSAEDDIPGNQGKALVADGQDEEGSHHI